MTLNNIKWYKDGCEKLNLNVLQLSVCLINMLQYTYIAVNVIQNPNISFY